jgi:hypothetical protein
MSTQQTETTPDLASHVAHLIRHDDEFPQSGVCLGPSDFLIERIRETWHRVLLRLDDGRFAEVSYKTDSERLTGRWRTATDASPDMDINALPAAIADALRANLPTAF